MRIWLAVAMLLVAHAGAAEQAVMIVRQDGVTMWFSAEVADSASARLSGLMYRRELSPRHGMWFDFERDSAVVMWMKNTLIPLDMIFVRDGAVIEAIHERAEPHSLARIAAPRAVRYVFEINAGEADRYAIGAGDRALLVRR